mgnify:CR=1 FL=1|tara:strand:- start:9508 stop:10593 length:1086 start_codon:yes stop_codon:yes gene_type:complete
MSNQFVFNQYYIDFIKRLKQASKKIKDDGKDNEKYELAKEVMKSIKNNYVTLDKSSDEYVIYINKLPEKFWQSYFELNDNNINEWFDNEIVKDIQLYQNITITNIRKIINDDFLCNHFLTVFYLFKNELTDENVKKYVSILQESYKEELYEEIENEEHKALLKRLNEIKKRNIKEKTGINMAGMEDTTIGKLAKEILEDVDVDKLQQSLGDKGDLLKAIGDPDSGFGDLISNVSRKMATKISNGELKQENLMQDAMKFASAMPGLFGGGENPGESGNSNKQQQNMSNMMNMMNSMMNNKDSADMFKNMMGAAAGGGGGGGGKGRVGKSTLNKNAYKKAMTTNKLKNKLAKRQQENQDVSDE